MHMLCLYHSQSQPCRVEPRRKGLSLRLRTSRRKCSLQTVRLGWQPKSFCYGKVVGFNASSLNTASLAKTHNMLSETYAGMLTLTLSLTCFFRFFYLTLLMRESICTRCTPHLSGLGLENKMSDE